MRCATNSCLWPSATPTFRSCSRSSSSAKSWKSTTRGMLRLRPSVRPFRFAALTLSCVLWRSLRWRGPRSETYVMATLLKAKIHPVALLDVYNRMIESIVRRRSVAIRRLHLSDHCFLWLCSGRLAGGPTGACVCLPLGVQLTRASRRQSVFAASGPLLVRQWHCDDQQMQDRIVFTRI
jgi:hypothetical protein